MTDMAKVTTCRHIEGHSCTTRGGACPFAVSFLPHDYQDELACELVNDQGIREGMLRLASSLNGTWGPIRDGVGNTGKHLLFGVVKSALYELARTLQTGDQVAVLAWALMNCCRQKGKGL